MGHRVEKLDFQTMPPEREYKRQQLCNVFTSAAFKLVLCKKAGLRVC